MGYESDIVHLKTWVLNSDRVLDNTKLLNLKADCERNNHREMYKEIIKMCSSVYNAFEDYNFVESLGKYAHINDIKEWDLNQT